jgi:23S rRNA pseudouridine1911/1915/1917 synthase
MQTERQIDQETGDDDVDGARTRVQIDVDERYAGERLDKALAQMIPDVSRRRLQQWIAAGAVRVNGVAVKPRHTLTFADVVELQPQPAADAAAFTPEPIPLEVVFEDDSILVVDKPAGLVVHPAAGNWSGTLLNGLLAYAPALAEIPRAGIVHRLDAGTSGLMVVAKTLASHTELVRQLQDRTVTREYWAVVFGVPPARGIIDAAIGRDPRNPLRFTVSRAASAKPARTHYARLMTATRSGAELSWLVCRLETGRTHQIRVHLEHLGHPLVGDPVYRRKVPAHAAETEWNSLDRQALHACRLSLDHPVSRERMVWFRTPRPDLLKPMKQMGFGPLDSPSRVFDA